MSRTHEVVDDLARLPTHAFGPRSLTWWGQAGIIAIEGTVFVLAAGAYFFLMSQEAHWPAGAPPPSLLYGSLFTALLLASEWPNVVTKHAAERHDEHACRRGLVAMSIVGAALLAVRAFEFAALNVRWDLNAYGSIVWALMVLHTAHLLTDWVDTLVLTALMHTANPSGARRYVDTSENSLYWHFVVFSWVPLYAIVYWAPRL